MTVSTRTTQTPALVELDRELARTAASLLQRQRPDGSWQGRLSPSAPATADVVIAMHLADPSGSADLIEAGVRWLLATQLADGGWGDDTDTAATLNGTALSVAALRLAAPQSSEAVRRGWARIEAFGGPEAVRDVHQCSLTVLVHHYLVLAGLMSAEGTLRVPVELALLPAPLRRKLTFAMPTAMAWGLMCARTMPGGTVRRIVNRVSRAPAERYLDGLVAFEGPHGGFVESPMMAANVCVGLTQAGVRPDIVQHCLRYFRATMKPEGAWSVTRDLEVDATNFITVGLQQAGHGSDPRVARAATWIVDAQRPEEFIWTGAPGGGWGWGLPSGWPNAGNTGDALITLAGDGRGVADPAVRDGASWLLRQQNVDGSWSCFAHVGRIAGLDPSFALVRRARSPKVLYGPCAVMTAEAMSGLAAAGAWRDPERDLRRAYDWLRQVQRPDGALENKWYLGLTAGTGSVLRALADNDLQTSEVADGCVRWLLRAQHDDGGWGDAVGRSTPEETAMALLGLVGVHGPGVEAALHRGARWLLEHRDADGLWPATVLGVYFLELLYRHDHTANGYALQALARYRRRRLADDAR